jgi:hypothetical protein
VILRQTELLDRLGEENVREMEKSLEESDATAAVAEEPTAPPPRKIKRKLTLKNYKAEEEEEKPSVQEPVEVSSFKIIGAPIKLKVKRAPPKA